MFKYYKSNYYRTNILKVFNTITDNFLRILKAFPIIFSFIAGLVAKRAFSHHESFLLLILSFEIFFVILVDLFNKKKYLKSFFAGYVYGFGLYAGILWWETYLHNFGIVDEHIKLLRWGTYLVSIVYVSIYYAFATFFSVRLAYNKTSLLFFFTVFVTLSEMLDAFFFDGYPFTVIAYGTQGIPYFTNIVSIVGTYGVTFLFLFILALLNLRRYWIYGVILLLLIIIRNFYDVNLSENYLTQDNDFEVSVAQPNFDYEKREHCGAKENCDDIARIAEVDRFCPKERKRIIITPETIIIGRRDQINYFRKTIAKNDNMYACTGFMEYKPTEDGNYKSYNTMHIYDNEKHDLASYSKTHLLTFSETFPQWLFKLAKILPKKYADIINNLNNMSPGDGKNSIKLNGIDQFAANICYDIMCPGKTMEDPLLSTWIMNIINLHCYYFENDISDLPHQQNVACKFRAMEYGKPVTVCANFGISCFIDCNGNILKKLKPADIGVIHQRFPLKYKITTFCIYGQKIILTILILLLLLLLGLSFYRKFSVKINEKSVKVKRIIKRGISVRDNVKKNNIQ